MSNESQNSATEQEYSIEEYREKFGDAALDSVGYVAEPTADTDSDIPDAAPLIPNFDEIEESDPHGMNSPAMDRAVPIASSILGTQVGAHLLARDLVSNAAENLVDKLLDMMEEFAEDVDVFVAEDGTRYRLTRLTGMTGRQRKAARPIIEELKGMLGGEAIDINGVLDTLLGCGRAEELFAILYVPEGGVFRIEDVPSRIEVMGDLTLGQMLGALYRFFISKGSFIRTGIHTFLVELVDRSILKL